jgi:glycosyltransferase involved in cell wall biosynthesis
MDQAKVSILLPTFARYRDGFLQRAVESALSQTWKNFELIVVDDGSLDGSEGYLAAVAARDARVVHLRLERNIGLPALTLSMAYKLASGDYFAWLFDDCELKPTHIETLVTAIQANSEWAMVFGVAEATLSDETHVRIGSAVVRDKLTSGHNDIPNVGVLLPRSTIERFGWYDPHVLLKRLCDWDLWARIAKEAHIGFVDQVVAVEHGARLPESLGRTNLLNSHLAVRYAHTDRNDRLRPEQIQQDDAFRRDILADMTGDEARDLEYVLFEHAFTTLDEARLRDSMDRLQRLDANVEQAERYAVQHGGPPQNDFQRLLIAAAAHLRRRTTQSAMNLIAYETLATERLAMIRSQEREIEHHRNFGLTQLTNAENAVGHLKSLQAQMDILNAELQGYRSIADERLEMYQAAAQLADERLAIADERLSLLAEEQQRNVELLRIAEERMQIIEHLQQGR